MVLNNNSFFYIAHRILSKTGVKSILVLFLMVLFFLFNGSMFVRFLNDMGQVEGKINYYRYWPEKREILNKKRMKLRRLSQKTGSAFCSLKDSNKFYENMLEQLKQKEMVIVSWKTESARISPNSAEVPIRIKTEGNPIHFLEFLQFLESAGNPVTISELRITQANLKKKTEFEISLMVIFKNE